MTIPPRKIAAWGVLAGAVAAGIAIPPLGVAMLAIAGLIAVFWAVDELFG
jgi:hypothetical protein